MQWESPRLDKEPIPLQVPRFSVTDELSQGVEYLSENGFAVFKDVASPEDIETGISLLWKWLDQFTESREDVSTWLWPDPHFRGIISGQGIGQSEFMWFSRALPGVKKIYSEIWETDNLITSFDGCCVHKPWEHNSAWKYSDKTWYHVDQNGHHKPGFHCVQGQLTFFDSGPLDGGLCVVKKSHLLFDEVFQERPKLKEKGDSVQFEKDRKFWETAKVHGCSSIKICCHAGDFLVWDSRTTHCSANSQTPRPLPETGLLPFRRVVAYICMVPRSHAPQEVLEKRKEALRKGWTTSHWPGELISVRKNSLPGFVSPELTQEQESLL